MEGLFPSNSSENARLRWSIIDALRRYGADAGKVGQVFARQHQLHAPDLQALIAVLSAEGHGHPLTPTRLRAELKLSSAGTSYVIDRLVAAGHVRRERDDPSDNRTVHLRYTAHGQDTAMAFFGPLGDQTERVLDGFNTRELKIIDRFLAGAAKGMKEHLGTLEDLTPDS